MDLAEFLQRQGEKLIRSGLEYRIVNGHSVTVRGNEWYNHAFKEGGGSISFVQDYCGLSYPETVARLPDSEQGWTCEPTPRKKGPKKELIQLPVGRGVRRLHAYFLRKCLIDREVLSTFVRVGLIYEDEKHHNTVFVGKDEHGAVRHAHKRNTSNMGKTFRINVGSSDPRHSFHWNGTSDRLYAFEAPIGLPSFLTLYSKDWQQHGYVALYGVGEQAMLWMPERTPETRHPILYLDHDTAGIKATGHLKETSAGRGHAETTILQSIHKDWNEDVRVRCRLETQSAEEHPRPVAASGVCKQACVMSTAVKLDRLNIGVPWLIKQYRAHLRWGRFGQAVDCME